MGHPDKATMSARPFLLHDVHVEGQQRDALKVIIGMMRYRVNVVQPRFAGTSLKGYPRWLSGEYGGKLPLICNEYNPLKKGGQNAVIFREKRCCPIFSTRVDKIINKADLLNFAKISEKRMKQKNACLVGAFTRDPLRL
jgi:uncharacterized C2H2 Zn-finger protein